MELPPLWSSCSPLPYTRALTDLILKALLKGIPAYVVVEAKRHLDDKADNLTVSFSRMFLVFSC